jgi:hypothetical protein
MTRRMQPSGVCSCCGKVGAVFADVEQLEDRTFVTVESDRCDLPPLCDVCEYAQKRWDARNSPHYPYAHQPPKTPPVRR